jgi:hypothetical protein
MAEDQTFEPAPNRRRAALTLLCIVVVAALVVASVYWATRSTKHAPKAAAPPTTPAVTTMASPTPSPTPHIVAKPKPAIPHQFVAATAPNWFTFKGPAFTISATVCGMEYIRPLDPPGEQHHTVCWVQHDFGYAPGSKGRGTTYVLGHAWGQDSLEVLNKISETVTRNVLPEYSKGAPAKEDGIPIYPSKKLDGYVLSLRTSTGLLRYKVRDAYAVSKEQAGNITHLVDQNVKNRVVLITCSELNHVDYDYNIVAEAYLMSSQSFKSTT